MRLFDEYVMVDWSASSTPKSGKDSVWIAAGRPGNVALENPRTRSLAGGRVRDLLAAAVAAGRRVLVGFDFPYGYPRGLARALDLPSGRTWAWFRVWEELARLVEDDERNRNNRFDVASRLNERIGSEPGPFWMRPESKATAMLPLRRPPFPYATRDAALPEFRASEVALAGRGLHAQSAWKLAGAGSVGGQALLGIPVVHALRFDRKLHGVSRVWPFETGFGTQRIPQRGPFVLHAEIWPRVFATPTPVGVVPDPAQVEGLVGALASLDAEERLAPLLAPGAHDAAASEEGWILGA